MGEEDLIVFVGSAMGWMTDHFYRPMLHRVVSKSLFSNDELKNKNKLFSLLLFRFRFLLDLFSMPNTINSPFIIVYFLFGVISLVHSTKIECQLYFS